MARRGELDRVVEQIAHDLSQMVAAAGNRDSRKLNDLKFDTVVFRHSFEHFHHAGDDLVKPHWLRIRL